jgi:hypothetical protein
MNSLDERIAAAEARWKEKTLNVPLDLALGESIKLLRQDIESLRNKETSHSASINKARMDRAEYLEACVKTLEGMVGQLIT